MAESHKRMRSANSSGGGSPINATAAAVKREQAGWAQSPTAAAAYPVGRPARAQAPTNSPPPMTTAVSQAPASSSSSAQGSSDGTGKFVIVVVDKSLWLHCSGCFATLKTPIYKCEAAGHKVCSACRGNGSNPCRACANDNNGAAAAASNYTRCGDDLDGLARAMCVPCPHKPYGCRKQVPYLDVDDHRRSCPDAPCSCSVFPCSGGFLGSPRALHDHLAGPAHSWPTTEIYTDSRGKAQQLDLTLTGPQSRQLLVSKDDGSVFVLLAAAAAGDEQAAAAAHVSLTCLRATATAQYWAVLWAHAPKDPVTGKEDRLQEEFVVQSRRSPCVGEDDGTLVSLKRKYLHGCGEEERKIQLYLRIDKLKSPSASSSARLWLR